jgi:hypothetical protein
MPRGIRVQPQAPQYACHARLCRGSSASPTMKARTLASRQVRERRPRNTSQKARESGGRPPEPNTGLLLALGLRRPRGSQSTPPDERVRVSAERRSGLQPASGADGDPEAGRRTHLVLSPTNTHSNQYPTPTLDVHFLWLLLADPDGENPQHACHAAPSGHVHSCLDPFG